MSLIVFSVMYTKITVLSSYDKSFINFRVIRVKTVKHDLARRQ